MFVCLFPPRFFAQIPVVNDDLPGRIISGRVLMKPNVKEFSGSSVIFDDGTVVEKVRDVGLVDPNSLHSS